MNSEDAAMELGAAVGRVAAQAWLGGPVGVPLGELVPMQVSGRRLGDAVLRQFGEIAGAVYDRLEPFLGRELRGLGEEERRALVDGVSGALGVVELRGGESAAESVRRITGAVRVPGGRLGEALFAECCEYAVRVVRALPVFEERTAGVAFGVDVARMVERLPDRALLAEEGMDRDTAFRRRYLEVVSETLDEVELFRRGAEGRLSVAYVSLRATGGGEGRVGRRGVPVLRPDMSGWEEFTGADAGGMRVEAALRGASRVLLRGEAGSGKTTLLRWLAVTAARGAFTGELAEWNGVTPVFVKLREYSGKALPLPGAMLDSVAGPITGDMPAGWVERQLTAGSALLLVDGVDELLDSERRKVREWVRKLLIAYPRARVVVTSRPGAAGADWLRRDSFVSLHLDRMSPPDIAAFVRQWHLAVRELGEEQPEYEQSLLNSLKDRAHLQALAGTPLLASMLCAMHMNRGSQLPRDRMELYRSALHMLVHERDAARNVPSAAGELSLGDKVVLLRDLAWRLSDNDRSEMSVGQAESYVGRKLTGMRHIGEPDGVGVLEQLRERSGMLRLPSEGRLGFVHRTFQEYLAAEEAAEEDRMGNLVGRAHLDIWRETIIMAAGHANTRQREELLGGILDRAAREPRHARKLRLLAASCQETMPMVSDGLAGRLDEAVDALLPARRVTDPPALAAVGGSLLRKMPRSLEGLSETAAVQTVLTAALIGGREALSLLVGYTGDERRAVIRTLISAWDYFDAHAYAAEVLADLPLADYLVTLSHTGQWSAAADLSHLRRVSASLPAMGLTPVSELPPLDYLFLIGRQDTLDLTPLTSQPELTHLHLAGFTSVTGVEVLEELSQLECLVLGISRQTDLTKLRLGPSLTTLQLWDADVRTWLRAESFPSSLRSLLLDNCTLPENMNDLDFPGVKVEVI
ncbi:NACHT domain-containing protein [Streptomyces sp. 4F14]|uniref:NACHT domain-containing protein n=1 Tax=Streptomyces sp. 4F14 TaxID=3394380 RepID=UPI003A878B39